MAELLWGATTASSLSARWETPLGRVDIGRGGRAGTEAASLPELRPRLFGAGCSLRSQKW